jgi:hypothetical protein
MLNTLRRAAVWTPGPIIDVTGARDALLPRVESVQSQTPEGDGARGLDGQQGIDLNGIIHQVAQHYLAQTMRSTGGNKAPPARLR